MKKIILFLFLFPAIVYADFDAQKVDLTALSEIATSDTVTLVANTATQLPDVGPVKSIILKASLSNAKLIRFGGSWVKSTSMSIATGDNVTLDLDELSDIYVRSEQTGDRLEYSAIR